MVRTVAAILVLGLAALPAAAQPAIGFEENAVVARGLTAGGSVVWFGVARERINWTSHVTEWQDAEALVDKDGWATLNLGREVPVKSVWVAVDMTTGGFAASSPPTYPWATHAAFPTEGAVFASDRVSLLSFRDDRQELEVLVVRPTVGAWRATVRHDDPASKEGTGVVFSYSDLIPWGKLPSSPGKLVPGDVIVAIDPNRMEYFAQQLGPGR